MSRAALLAALLASAAARNINVQLQAPWKTSVFSPLQETSEFLAHESPALFWRFVESFGDVATTIDAWTGAGAFSEDAFDEALAVAQDKAEALLSPLSASLLKMALVTRSYAPRTQLHYALAPAGAPCGIGAAFLVVEGGDPVCEPAAFGAAVAARAPRARRRRPRRGRGRVMACHRRDGRREHVAGGGVMPEEGAPARCCTGAPGTTAFAAAPARSRSSRGAVRYALRHSGAVAPAATAPTMLQGFGVILDIKNMEYRNFDDSAKEKKADDDGAAKGASEEAVSFEEGAEVQGVVFSTLLARKPKLGRELASLREALVEEAQGAASEMKVWKLRDLGLQAMLSVSSSADPLRRLQEVAQDFPSHMTSLSTIKISDDVRAEVALNHRLAQQLPILAGGAIGGDGARATLYLTASRSAESKTFSVFTLLKLARTEAAGSRGSRRSRCLPPRRTRWQARAARRRERAGARRRGRRQRADRRALGLARRGLVLQQPRARPAVPPLAAQPAPAHVPVVAAAPARPQPVHVPARPRPRDRRGPRRAPDRRGALRRDVPRALRRRAHVGARGRLRGRRRAPDEPAVRRARRPTTSRACSRRSRRSTA